MDRNRGLISLYSIGAIVALRKESVDRNSEDDGILSTGAPSLSARRAWIEIDMAPYMVARFKSLSARRAWIEM